MTFWQSDASAIYEQFVKTELTLVCCETFLSWDSVWQGEYCVNCSCLFSLVKIGLCDLLGNLKWKKYKKWWDKDKNQKPPMTANQMLKLICRIGNYLIPRIPERNPIKKQNFHRIPFNLKIFWVEGLHNSKMELSRAWNSNKKGKIWLQKFWIARMVLAIKIGNLQTKQKTNV